MLQAHVTVELLPDDASAEKLLYILEQEFRSHVPCRVVRKEQFPIERNFEQGLYAAVKGALETNLPWGVYIAPRRLDIRVNGAFVFPLNSMLLAVARRRQAAALFLYTFATREVPDRIAIAISEKVDEAQRTFVKTALTDRDGQTVENIRKSVANAYVQACGPMFNQ